MKVRIGKALSGNKWHIRGTGKGVYGERALCGADLWDGWLWTDPNDPIICAHCRRIFKRLLEKKEKVEEKLKQITS